MTLLHDINTLCIYAWPTYVWLYNDDLLLVFHHRYIYSYTVSSAAGCVNAMSIIWVINFNRSIENRVYWFVSSQSTICLQNEITHLVVYSNILRCERFLVLEERQRVVEDKLLNCQAERARVPLPRRKAFLPSRRHLRPRVILPLLTNSQRSESPLWRGCLITVPTLPVLGPDRMTKLAAGRKLSGTRQQ